MICSKVTKKFLCSVTASVALVLGCSLTSWAYPDRPDSARVWYEVAYFPVRIISMACAIVWDVPTAALQDSVKGAIGGTKMVSRNLGKETGVYEMSVGGATGGTVGCVAGAAYGLMHGFGYGTAHGFAGYPSTSPGSYSTLFSGKQFTVPYGDNY